MNPRATAFRSLVAASAAILCTGILPADDAQTEKTAVTVDINDTKVVNRVSKKFHGENFCAFWNNTGDSPATLKAFAQSGMKLIRFPGGTTAHWHDWEHPFPEKWRDVWRDSAAWNLVKDIDGELILQTNCTQNKPDSGLDSSGEHQAGWLEYAEKHGYKVAFWEIGNEPEIDALNKRSQQVIMLWYNNKYEEQVKAIRKKYPKARLLGYSGTNVWFWWAQRNLERFLAAHGNKKGSGLVDAISLHWYAETGTRKWEDVRGVPQSWWSDMEYIRACIQHFDTRDLEVYITEWNFGGGMPADSSAQLFRTALGNADMVGMFLRTGVKGHTHFVLQGPDNAGWGILSMKGSKRGEAAPFATYFALSMASRLTGKVLETKCSVDEKNVLSAYAAQDEAGNMCAMLINKADKPADVKLVFAQLNPKGKDVSIYRLEPANGKPGDLESVYNGVNEPKPGKEDLPPPEKIKCPEQLQLTLKPFSMAVASIAGTPAITARETRAPIDDAVIKRLKIGTLNEPAVNTNRTAVPVDVPFYDGKLTVDGDAADWGNIAALPCPFKKADTSSMKLCWNKEGLFGVITAKDSEIKINRKEPWKSDCLELFVEKDCAGSWENSKAAQYVFAPDPENGAGKCPVKVPYGGSVDKPEMISGAWKPVDSGYVIEFEIPAALLGPATMTDGCKIGFNYALSDNGKPVEQFFSDKNADSGYCTPAHWGIIRLKR